MPVSVGTRVGAAVTTRIAVGVTAGAGARVTVRGTCAGAMAATEGAGVGGLVKGERHTMVRYRRGLSTCRCRSGEQRSISKITRMRVNEGQFINTNKN